jgi:hypothetical protein
MSQVQLEAFFLVQNACTAFPSTFVSMLELSPPLPILPLLRVAGLSGLNTIIVHRNVLDVTSRTAFLECGILLGRHSSQVVGFQVSISSVPQKIVTVEETVGYL